MSGQCNDPEGDFVAGIAVCLLFAPDGFLCLFWKGNEGVVFSIACATPRAPWQGA